jgi:hypothetical protein
MSLGWGKVNKMYFYLENGYGVDLIKVQIKNLHLHPTTIGFANSRAMFL